MNADNNQRLLLFAVLLCAGLASGVMSAENTDLYGDPLPQGAVARIGSLWLRHAELSDFVFLPDGKTILTAGGRVVRFWDLTTKKLIREVKLQGANGPMVHATLSPDGKTVAALNQKKLCFWEVNSGRQMKTIDGQPENAVYLHFSPDGKRLAIGTWDGKVPLWEWEMKKERRLALPPRKFGIDSAFHGCFSPDGQWFVAGGGWDSPLCVYESATGREVRRFDCSASISTVSPDGNRLAVASMKNDAGAREVVLRFFDLSSGKEFAPYPQGHQENYFSLAFSPKGRFLACGTSERSCVLDYTSGRIVQRLSGYPGKMTFAPDSKTLAASANSRLRLWNMAMGREENPGDLGKYPVMAINPNARLLAVAEAGEPAISLWDTATGRLLRTLRFNGEDHYVQGLFFSSDGQTVVAGQSSRSLQFWDAASGKEQRTVQLRDANRPDPHTHLARKFHVSEDGKRVSTLEAFGVPNESTRLALWDTDSGKLLSQHVMPPRVLPAYSILEPAWSADSASVTVRRNDGLTQMRVASGAIRFRIPDTSDVHALTASPDDRLLAAARGTEGKDKNSVCIWEATTGMRITAIATGHVSALALMPDNRHLVSADRGFLRMWDMATGQEQAHRPLPEANTAIGSDGVVTRLLLSPDGRHAFTALNDGTALVWDLQTRAQPQAGKASDKELDAWWNDLAEEDARRAYAALWRLSDTPEATILFLRNHVKPATEDDIKAIRRLIADLDSDDFTTREKAFEHLAKLGRITETVMRQALAQNPTLESRRRLQLLLEKIDQQPPAGETLRLLRAMQVLENTGAEGRRLLRELANGAEGAWLTQAAQAALLRLNRRTP